MRFEIITSLILLWSSDQNSGAYSQDNTNQSVGRNRINLNSLRIYKASGFIPRLVCKEISSLSKAATISVART